MATQNQTRRAVPETFKYLSVQNPAQLEASMIPAKSPMREVRSHMAPGMRQVLALHMGSLNGQVRRMIVFADTQGLRILIYPYGGFSQ